MNSGKELPPVAAPGIVFLFAFFTYLISAPRTVVLDDDGYFLLAAFFNGVAHPPGYPLYTFIAHLATLFPLGTVALRVHAMSALLASAAVVCLWFIARRMLRDSFAASAAALCYAFSTVFWSQAIVAEVYALHALILYAMCLLALRAESGAATGTMIILVSFLYGLGLANHWPLILLSTPMLAYLLWPLRADIRRQAVRALAATALGLTPYLWMIARSHSSEIAFNGPIENPSDFWFYLSRKGYADVDWSAAAEWIDRLEYMGFSAAETALQFGPFGIAFAVIGFACQWKAWPARWCRALVAGFLCNTLLLAVLLGFEYDFLHRHTFSVYAIAGYGIAALWLGLGVREACKWAARYARPVIAGPMLALLLAGTTWFANAAANYRADDTFAADFARTMLETLPRKAILFVQGDYATGAVGYLNLVEGVRRDVRLYNVRGQVLPNRLYRGYAPDPREMRRAIDQLIISSPDPVYYSMSLPHGFGKEYFGLYTRVMTGHSAGVVRAVLEPRIAGFMEQVLARGAPDDGAELVQYRQFESLYCRLLAMLQKHGTENAGQLRDRLDLFCTGLHGLLQWGLVTLDPPDPQPAAALELFERARTFSGQAVINETLALLEQAFDRAAKLQDDRDD